MQSTANGMRSEAMTQVDAIRVPTLMLALSGVCGCVSELATRIRSLQLAMEPLLAAAPPKVAEPKTAQTYPQNAAGAIERMHVEMKGIDAVLDDIEARL